MSPVKEDDMIRLVVVAPDGSCESRYTIPAERFNIEQWPPPAVLTVAVPDGEPLTFHRATYSTFEGDHPNVCRGAAYVTDLELWNGQT